MKKGDDQDDSQMDFLGVDTFDDNRHVVIADCILCCGTAKNGMVECDNLSCKCKCMQHLHPIGSCHIVPDPTIVGAGCEINCDVVYPVLVRRDVGSALTAGPNIENVMKQTAERIGVQPSDLVCRNGRLARESSVVFELKEGVLLRSDFDKVSSDADVVRLLLETLSTAHVETFSVENMEIRKFCMEYNTVFTVSVSDRTYVIFYGNAVI